jgi:hypothetical protein
MNAVSHNLFGQLLLPLQGVVNFFSPPAQAASPFSGAVIGAQPCLAKAPALPSNPRSPSAQTKIQPAGIRMVSKDLMGNMTGNMSASQILRSRRAQDGRIVISGRMRDVCAELDRLCDEPV